MDAKRIESVDAPAPGGEIRRQWVKPQIHDMVAGAAELGGDFNVDGDPGFS